MKKAIASLCLVSLGLAGGLRIGVNPRFGVQNAYGLSCEGAVGQVKYYVEGLPNGVTFENEAIVISNWAVAGNYTVKIRAVDSNGNSAEKVISLTINSQTSTGGVAGSAGGVAGGAGGVAGGAGGVAGGAGGAGGAPGAGGAGGAPGGSGGAPGGGAPGGGAPGGGAPGGGAPGGGAPGRLDSILGNYGGSGVPSTPNWGNTGRYPEPNFPTGGSPGLNPTTIRIGGDQAQPTPANRNPITPDDVALRAASERHQNAIKGITNLLKIIDQAKANKDKAQSDIQTYTQAYNDAVSAQRAAQNDIIAAETRTSQITSAINSLTTTIDDLRNKIAQAGTARDGYTREKTTITATITGLEGTKAGLLEKLKGIDNEVGQRVKELSDKNSECQSLADAVNRKTNELTNAQNEYAGLETTRNTLSIDITRKSGIVDDLRRQLQQAEKDLADAKIRLSDLDARRLALPVQISTLKGELDELQRRAKACADEVTRIQNIINGLKTGDYNGLTNQIKDLDGKISAQRTRVTEIDAQLASSQGPLEDLKAKLASATEDLSFVRTQKNDADGNLRIAYQRGNDSNNRVAFAKQNIDAVIKRFQDESKIVSDATMNLERARAEEALARLGLEELIAHYTNALPYAIVPNGNGATNPGTPFGNNPSGSPLGPINANGNGAPGSFRVNSWTNYLSTAYGAGVNPSFPGSVTELFPFNFLSGTSGNQGSGTTVTNAYGNIRGGFTGGAGGAGGAGSAGGCGGAIPTGQTPVVTTGIVVAVRGDSFDVKSDNNGQVYTVGVSPCSQLNANRPDYIMETGHTAVVKGYQTQQYKIEASQATCLKQ